MSLWMFLVLYIMSSFDQQSLGVCQLLLVDQKITLNGCSLWSVLAAINIYIPFPLRAASNGNGFVRQQFLQDESHQQTVTNQTINNKQSRTKQPTTNIYQQTVNNKQSPTDSHQQTVTNQTAENQTADNQTVNNKQLTATRNSQQ